MAANSTPDTTDVKKEYSDEDSNLPETLAKSVPTKVLKERGNNSGFDFTDQQDEVEKNGEQHECDICGKEFKSTRAVKIHFLKAHVRRADHPKADKCEICGESCTNQDDLEEHVRAAHMINDRYACELCTKTFAVKFSLANHRRCHTGEKPYLCDVCGRPFATSGDMNVHKRIHTGEKAYSCPHCPKFFRKSGDLHRHVRRMHTRQRLFPCKDCGKELVTPEELVRHGRTHTGEKPYSCDICGKQFSMNWLLGKHVRSVHAPGGPSYCELCQKPYSATCEKKGHIRIKTGGEGFEKPNVGKRYSCDVCGRLFIDRGSLLSHLRGHTGEKPFKCRHCSKTFTSESLRARHFRNVCNKEGK